MAFNICSDRDGRSSQLRRLEFLAQRIKTDGLTDAQVRGLDLGIAQCELAFGTGGESTASSSSELDGDILENIIFNLQAKVSELLLRLESWKRMHHTLIQRLLHTRLDSMHCHRRNEEIINQTLSPEGVVCSNMAYLKYRVQMLELEMVEKTGIDREDSSTRHRSVAQFRQEWEQAEVALAALQHEHLGAASGVAAAESLLTEEDSFRQQRKQMAADPPPPYSSPGTPSKSGPTDSSSASLSLRMNTHPLYHPPSSTPPLTRRRTENMRKPGRNVPVPMRQSSRSKLASLGTIFDSDRLT